jgi:hypothetical protein
MNTLKILVRGLSLLVGIGGCMFVGSILLIYFTSHSMNYFAFPILLLVVLTFSLFLGLMAEITK